ncbi:MAG: DNA cytosine methyltransferase [Chlorobi bacterium]|nr:DNA cytosine methyltransferase [Chlorobiota bacterium]
MPELKKYIVEDSCSCIEDGQLNIYGKEEPDIAEKSVWDKSVKVEENGYYWNKEPVFQKGGFIPDDKLIVVELFSGCGGTSLGFEMAGFEIVLGCDIHTPSIQTFKTNHPNSSTITGDIKKVNPLVIKELLGDRKLDVLIGGIPCQGFSLNNRKRHENDDRNYMYKEFARFVEVLQPRVVVLENVSGMKSTGNFVSDIETHLSDIGNMTVKSQLLYAADYGVPQRRTRLVFVGIKGKEFDFNSIVKTHGKGTGRDYVTVKDAIGDLPSLNTKETKNKYDKKPFSPFQELMRMNANGTVTGHTAPNHPLATIEKIKNTKPGEPMYERFKQRIRLAWDILSPTQVSGGIRPQFQLGHPEDNRGLTIRERCRIQSFPDDFIVKGGTVQARVQTGNAVPPLLAKAVGLAIKKYL